MPDDIVQTDGATTEGQGQQGDAGEPADVLGLRKALAAERAARQAAAKEAAELRTAREAAERKAAEEAGKHRELYEGIKPKYEDAISKLTAYEAREAERIARATERNAARTAALPEPLRALVPEGLDPDATAAQIERLEGLARQQTYPAGSGAGAGAGGAKKPSLPPEAVAYAAQLGKTGEAAEKLFPAWLLTPAGRAWKSRQTGS